MNTYDKNEKWMRDQIRARGYLDSLSPSSLSGRYAEARVRIEKAEKALQDATDTVDVCLRELESEFPKPAESQDIGIRL